MAKMTRENKVREKQMEKAARRAARKLEALENPGGVEEAHEPEDLSWLDRGDPTAFATKDSPSEQVSS